MTKLVFLILREERFFLSPSYNEISFRNNHEINNDDVKKRI
jgi:hypothetical protein